MILVYAFCPRDEDQALKNAQWMLELGSYKGHEILVSYDPRCNEHTVEEIGLLMLKMFDKVWRLKVEAEIDGWPQGANYMFSRSATWLQSRTQYSCFFWLEPDAIPLREGWMDELEAEYRRSGKPFMGERVDLGEKRPDVPVHMSGVGIYQNPIYLNAGEAYRAHDVAWDIAAKDQILPRAHFTKAIQHYWKHGTFTHLMEVRRETLVFHSSKDGSLIDVMRRKRHDDIFPAPSLAEDHIAEANVPEARESDKQIDRNDKFTADSCGGEAIRKLRGGIWVLADDNIISEQVVTSGRLDFDTLIPYVTALIRPGDTVLDVGAFIGDHTVAYADKVGAAGSVFAYEPNAAAFQCLVHNTNGMSNVFGFCHALGRNDGIAGLAGDHASGYLDHNNAGGGPIVQVRRLDIDAALFHQVDLIKIDVEGYELNVLEGAEQVITRFRPKLVIEINEIALKRQNTAKEDVFLWLNEHGYKWKVLHYHQDNAPFYDILCLPEVTRPNSVVQDTMGQEGFPVVSSPPPAIPASFVKVSPREEMITAIAFLKDFAAKSAHNRMLVMQRLTYAGLKTPTYKKKKP